LLSGIPYSPVGLICQSGISSWRYAGFLRTGTYPRARSMHLTAHAKRLRCERDTLQGARSEHPVGDARGNG